MLKRLCLSAISLLAFLTPSFAQQQPSMVYMLNRHGVSPCLDPPPKETGAQLFDSSYERNYIKGQKLRQIYPTLLSPGYKYNEIHVNASAWQRTIASAHGVLQGLFPSLNNNTARIPVFTNAFEFDYTLYNYDYKCPNFDNDWDKFQQTTEWKTKVQQYSNLTTYLNTINNLKPYTYTLEGIYSIWEVYNTIKRYPETGLRGFAPIDDYTMNTLDEAVQYVESKKWSESIAKDYFGNTFLAAVRYRMEMYINKNIVFGKRLAMSFAHYPNILFTLASLGYTGPVSKLVPGYNSALNFELYNQTNNKVNFPSGWSIKVRYFEGNKNWPSHNSMADGHPIALGSCVEGQECEIDYNNFWNTYKVKNLEQWCNDCGSTSWICHGSIQRQNATTVIYEQISNNNYKDDIQIACLVILSVILALYLVVLTKQYLLKPNNKYEVSTSQQQLTTV